MTGALQCFWIHKIWSIITLICFCVRGIWYVMQCHWTHVPTHCLQELESPYLMTYLWWMTGDWILTCINEQKGSKKILGWYVALWIDQYPSPHFLFFYHSTLAPNHPSIPITSLTKLELTGGFFFHPRIARKSVIWNGYHFGDNLSP